MSDRFEHLAQEIAKLNLQIRHDMEQAEAKVVQVNDLIDELGRTGLLNDVWLGPTYGQRYAPESGIVDSELVVQAALLVRHASGDRGGFGVCLWDMEEYCRLQSGLEDLKSNANRVFLPFNECDAAQKAFLLPHLESLFEELADVALVAASQMEPEPTVSADEFFQATPDDSDDANSQP